MEKKYLLLKTYMEKNIAILCVKMLKSDISTTWDHPFTEPASSSSSSFETKKLALLRKLSLPLLTLLSLDWICQCGNCSSNGALLSWPAPSDLWGSGRGSEAE